MIRNIHQKNCWFPMAAAGAMASATNTTQITERITSKSLNFFLPLIVWLLTWKMKAGEPQLPRPGTSYRPCLPSFAMQLSMVAR